jgi:hypothetical protein
MSDFRTECCGLNSGMTRAQGVDRNTCFVKCRIIEIGISVILLRQARVEIF